MVALSVPLRSVYSFVTLFFLIWGEAGGSSSRSYVHKVSTLPKPYPLPLFGLGLNWFEFVQYMFYCMLQLCQFIKICVYYFLKFR